LLTFSFLFFLKWFCGVWWMIWWCMKCYDFLFETIWYACMDVWMHEWNLLYFFIFSFLHKSKKCWRSYAYVHVMNHWLCMTCYDFLFKLRRWCMHGCVDTWMHRWNLLYAKRWFTHLCMTWYDVWIFLLHFFENDIWIDSHFIVISNSWSHSTLIFFYFYLNHFLGLINLLTNTFSSFLWNTISMTYMKLPRAWKGLDEVMKIN